MRFNAKKEAAGKYFSTTIWRFTMYCSNDGAADSRRGNCANEIVIETDPKNTEYNVAKGAVRKVESYSAEDAGTIEMIGKDERNKIEADPFTKLEHKQGEMAKSVDQRPRVAQIKAMSDSKHGDDYSSNQALRRKFRKEKKIIKQVEEQRERDIARVGVSILPLTREDKALAAAVRFHAPLSASERSKQQRLSIMAAPIIAGPSTSTTNAGQRRLEKIKDRIGASWQTVDKKTLEKKRALMGPSTQPAKKPRFVTVPQHSRHQDSDAKR